MKQWAVAECKFTRLKASPEIDRTELPFLKGMSALAQRNYGAGIRAFRELLAARPELMRVRLELARALFLAGQDNEAKALFAKLLNENLPAQVADNVRRFLQRIRGRKNWRFDVSFGFHTATLSDARSRRGSLTYDHQINYPI